MRLVARELSLVGRPDKTMLALLSWPAGFSIATAAHISPVASHTSPRAQVQMQADRMGFFSIKDVALVERSDEDVAAFHAKERRRWLEVYEEEYVEAPQEFYPGDRVRVISDVAVKKIENAKGMQGVVTHFEFDDGYESCQTCSTTAPVWVLLDESS